MEKCGFEQVHAEDCSDLYQQYCLHEIEIAEKNRTNPNSVNIRLKAIDWMRLRGVSFFFQKLTSQELNECVRQWKLKYSLTNSGQRRWCIFEAMKRKISCDENGLGEE